MRVSVHDDKRRLIAIGIRAALGAIWISSNIVTLVSWIGTTPTPTKITAEDALWFVVFVIVSHWSIDWIKELVREMKS